MTYPPARCRLKNRGGAEQDIVPAGTFAETALQDGDTLELLQFVGGGKEGHSRNRRI
ncbi:MAG: sulfur carrier protein ThiS [Bilophila wadsworthia]